MFLSLLLSSLLTFVELNCENLFDLHHDSLKNDVEFLPTGSYRWTPTRYWRKLNHLAQELVALGEDPRKQRGWQMPDIVALCEVENDTVMHDLTRRSLLRNVGYEYLITQSPDERGIDVALLYIPSSFAPLRHYPLRISPLPSMRPTRDILYVCGRVSGGDSLHVFVVHAPSRRGGESATQPFRMEVMRRLAQSVDSIYAIEPAAHVLVAGDFNDYSDSPALLSLSAGQRLIEVSLHAEGFHGAHATYRWHGEWRSLDHVFCSQSLHGCLVDCYIGDLPFLLEEDEKYGGVKPYRTYLGPRYLGGYSDHLPLVVHFDMEK